MEVEGSQASIQTGGAANPQALSIALVLPQPTAQTSTQTTQTQVTYYYDNSVRITKPTNLFTKYPINLHKEEILCVLWFKASRGLIF